MRTLTAEWVNKADADYRLAAKLVRGSEPFHDQICFDSQQAAEKFLKALMEELRQPVPRTHVLEHLLDLLLPHHAALRSFRRGLRFLTRFAVTTRYPGKTATKRQAQAALRWASHVRRTAEAILGKPPRRARRRRSP
jgi:HEPN domain-containing protein